MLALDPKHRDVLVLRFYEELPPREVATRLDIPVNTVRTRTRRAIERIRGVFDLKYGGRKAWSAAIAGLLLVPAAASAGVSKLAVAATLLVVTGATLGLLHVATRDEPPTQTRVALDAERDARRGVAKPTATAGTGEPGKPHPTHFRGQFFDAKTKQPLVGAGVLFGTHLSTPLATAVTDEDGRFTFRWNRSWKLLDSEWQAFEIGARKDRRWCDPFYPTRDGLDKPEGMRVTVELIDNPRFQFVVGAGRQPVAGARLSLFVPPQGAGMELGAPISTAVTDARGMVASEWPSWLGIAILRLERPSGDVLQWRLLLTQARSYDPYDIAIDESDVATVHMQVLEEDGSPAGAGVRVFADGIWGPDGLIETPYNRTLAPGAETTPLVGTTNKHGVATFRFPADRARDGYYVPWRMAAFRMRDTRPDFVAWKFDPHRAAEEQVARTGCALPTLRFGPGPGRLATVAVRGVRRYGDLEFHGRVGRGPVRFLPLDFENIMQVAGYTLIGFRDADGGPPREGEEICAVLHEDEVGYRTTHLSAEEFARCLRGEAVMDLGPPQKARVIRIDAPGAGERYVCWLESVDQPLRLGVGLDNDGPTTVELPDVPGQWRIRFDEDDTVAAVIDPHAKSEFKLGDK